MRLGSYSSRSTVAGWSHLRRLKSTIAILLLVTAGDAARGHVALVVAAARLAQAFGQRLDGLALPQRRPVDQDEAAARRAGRVIMLECHRLRSPSSRRSTGLRPASRSPSSRPSACRARPSSCLVLPFCDDRVDARHVDVEQRLDGGLDLRLGRVAGDLEDDRVVLGEQRRLLGDVRAQRSRHSDGCRSPPCSCFLAIEARLQLLDRGARQHQRVMLQDVVDVGADRRQHVDARQVADDAARS